jgi:hypothetical protein
MSEPYSEADTRQQIIDRRLRLAGWRLDDPSQVIQELDIYLRDGYPLADNQRGRLERRDLVESPFTQLHPQGVRGVFPPQEIEEILGFAKGLVA